MWTGKEADGATTHEHVEIAKKSAFASLVINERTFEEMPADVKCPIEVEYLWQYFLELDKTRQNGGMGFNPITHEEITAWDEGMKIGLIPFERMAIRRIDEAYQEHVNSKDKGKNVRE